jgi:hypothetical protein
MARLFTSGHTRRSEAPSETATPESVSPLASKAGGDLVKGRMSTCGVGFLLEGKGVMIAHVYHSGILSGRCML